ncbi:MAG: hypothetical protein NT154_09595 [Verrucomicrobia bacterium]|nr:hypothetical protein [Verrucomicrobiota bacterium]
MEQGLQLGGGERLNQATGVALQRNGQDLMGLGQSLGSWLGHVAHEGAQASRQLTIKV